MESSFGDLKIEVVQEIWRFPDLTFNVFYGLEGTAYIKAMRGEFNRKILKQIKEIMLSRGIQQVKYERLKMETKKERTIDRDEVTKKR